jgi:hypothetical protein
VGSAVPAGGPGPRPVVPGLFRFGNIRRASLVTGHSERGRSAVRSNKVTLIWGVLTLVSLLVVLVLMALGVVSL